MPCIGEDILHMLLIDRAWAASGAEICVSPRCEYGTPEFEYAKF